MVKLLREQAEVAAQADGFVRGPAPGLTLVVGGPGVGKSVMLDKIVAGLQESEVPVLRITGDRALQSVPLGPFALLLRSRSTSIVTEMVELRRRLAKMGAASPVVLAVDDVHAIDDVSAMLLADLASIDKVRVLAIGRDHELWPEAVTSLAHQTASRVLTLKATTLDQLGILVEHILGDPGSTEVLAALWAQTRGNVLVASHLLRASFDIGALQRDKGMVHLRSPLPSSLTVYALLNDRVSRLEPECRVILESLAVAGPLEIRILEQIADLIHVAALERAGIVVANENGDHLVVRVAQSLYADALASSLPADVRARRLTDLSDASDRVPGGHQPDILRVATWRLEAGHPVDSMFLVKAARRSLRRHAFDLAEKFASAAMREAGTFLYLQAVVTWADALNYQGRYQEVCGPLAAAIGTALEAGAETTVEPYASYSLPFDEACLDRVSTISPLLDALRAQVDTDFCGAGSFARVHSALEAATSALPALSGPLRPLRGHIAVSAGRPLQALDEVPPDSQYALLGPGVWVVSEALRLIARPAAALAKAKAILAIPKLDEISALTSSYGHTLRDAGRRSDVLTWSESCWNRAVVDGDPKARCEFALLLGVCALDSGALGDADTWFAEAAQQGELSFARPYAVRWARGGALLAAAQLGDLERAVDLQRVLDQTPPHDFATWSSIEAFGRAWLAAQLGHIQEGVEHLHRSIQDWLTTGRYADVLRATAEAIRIGGVDAALLLAPPLRHLDVDGALFTSLAAIIACIADVDLDGVRANALALQAAGSGLLACELVGVAATWSSHQHGWDRSTISDWYRTGLALVDIPEKEMVTPVIHRMKKFFELTEREHQVATLTVLGMKAKEIAVRETIGIRTVESHLFRVYGKLGINSKDELIGVLPFASTAPQRRGVGDCAFPVAVGPGDRRRRSCTAPCA